ncbi:hypothetical protein DFJ77DRAFT_245452 [Powellomyces hirtus]|nr:hypothetical protein DFJ77DRAFT_245452 [Powellomyces hirtus]
MSAERVIAHLLGYQADGRTLGCTRDILETEPCVTIGRAKECSVRCMLPTFALQHVKLTLQTQLQKCAVTCFDPINGAFLNTTKLPLGEETSMGIADSLWINGRRFAVAWAAATNSDSDWGWVKRPTHSRCSSDSNESVVSADDNADEVPELGDDATVMVPELVGRADAHRNDEEPMLQECSIEISNCAMQIGSTNDGPTINVADARAIEAGEQMELQDTTTTTAASLPYNEHVTQLDDGISAAHVVESQAVLEHRQSFSRSPSPCEKESSPTSTGEAPASDFVDRPVTPGADVELAGEVRNADPSLSPHQSLSPMTGCVDCGNEDVATAIEQATEPTIEISADFESLEMPAEDSHDESKLVPSTIKLGAMSETERSENSAATESVDSLVKKTFDDCVNAPVAIGSEEMTEEKNAMDPAYCGLVKSPVTERSDDPVSTPTEVDIEQHDEGTQSTDLASCETVEVPVEDASDDGASTPAKLQKEQQPEPLPYPEPVGSPRGLEVESNQQVELEQHESLSCPAPMELPLGKTLEDSTDMERPADMETELQSEADKVQVLASPGLIASPVQTGEMGQTSAYAPIMTEDKTDESVLSPLKEAVPDEHMTADPAIVRNERESGENTVSVRQEIDLSAAVNRDRTSGAYVVIMSEQESGQPIDVPASCDRVDLPLEGIHEGLMTSDSDTPQTQRGERDSSTSVTNHESTASPARKNHTSPKIATTPLINQRPGATPNKTPRTAIFADSPATTPRRTKPRQSIVIELTTRSSPSPLPKPNLAREFTPVPKAADTASSPLQRGSSLAGMVDATDGIDGLESLRQKEPPSPLGGGSTPSRGKDNNIRESAGPEREDATPKRTTRAARTTRVQLTTFSEQPALASPAAKSLIGRKRGRPPTTKLDPAAEPVLSPEPIADVAESKSEPPANEEGTTPHTEPPPKRATRARAAANAEKGEERVPAHSKKAAPSAVGVSHAATEGTVGKKTRRPGRAVRVDQHADELSTANSPPDGREADAEPTISLAMADEPIEHADPSVSPPSSKSLSAYAPAETQPTPAPSTPKRIKGPVPDDPDETDVPPAKRVTRANAAAEHGRVETEIPGANIPAAATRNSRGSKSNPGKRKTRARAAAEPEEETCAILECEVQGDEVVDTKATSPTKRVTRARRPVAEKEKVKRVAPVFDAPAHSEPDNGAIMETMDSDQVDDSAKPEKRVTRDRAAAKAAKIDQHPPVPDLPLGIELVNGSTQSAGDKTVSAPPAKRATRSKRATTLPEQAEHDPVVIPEPSSPRTEGGEGADIRDKNGVEEEESTKRTTRARAAKPDVQPPPPTRKRAPTKPKKQTSTDPGCDPTHDISAMAESTSTLPVAGENAQEAGNAAGSLEMVDLPPALSEPAQSGPRETATATLPAVGRKRGRPAKTAPLAEQGSVLPPSPARNPVEMTARPEEELAGDSDERPAKRVTRARVPAPPSVPRTRARRTVTAAAADEMGEAKGKKKPASARRTTRAGRAQQEEDETQDHLPSLHLGDGETETALTVEKEEEELEMDGDEKIELVGLRAPATPAPGPGRASSEEEKAGGDADGVAPVAKPRNTRSRAAVAPEIEGKIADSLPLSDRADDKEAQGDELEKKGGEKTGVTKKRITLSRAAAQVEGPSAGPELEGEEVKAVHEPKAQKTRTTTGGSAAKHDPASPVSDSDQETTAVKHACDASKGEEEAGAGEAKLRRKQRTRSRATVAADTDADLKAVLPAEDEDRDGEFGAENETSVSVGVGDEGGGKGKMPRTIRARAAATAKVDRPSVALAADVGKGGGEVGHFVGKKGSVKPRTARSRTTTAASAVVRKDDSATAAAALEVETAKVEQHGSQPRKTRTTTRARAVADVAAPAAKNENRPDGSDGSDDEPQPDNHDGVVVEQPSPKPRTTRARATAAAAATKPFPMSEFTASQQPTTRKRARPPSPTTTHPTDQKRMEVPPTTRTRVTRRRVAAPAAE